MGARASHEEIAPPAAATGGDCLLLGALPEQLLLAGPLSFLSAAELGRCALLSRAAQCITAAPEQGGDVGSAAALWETVLRRAGLLPLPHCESWVGLARGAAAAAVAPAAPSKAAELRAAVAVAAAPACALCDGRWGWEGRPWRDGPSRCPCAAQRSLALSAAAGGQPRMRLTVGFFDCRRCSDAHTGACFGGDGFRCARTLLGRHFDLRLRPLESLVELLPEEAAAAAAAEGGGVQLLFCDTWSCAVALAPAEATALQRWVDRGGTLVANVFSNWIVGVADEHVSLLSLFAGGAMAAELRSPLLPAYVAPRSVWPNIGSQWPPMLEPEQVALACGGGDGRRTAAAARELATLVRGPFGSVQKLANRVETSFTVPHRRACKEGGVLPLSLSSRAPELDADPEHCCTAAYLPPAADRAKRAGRCLFATNNHWLADPGHWNGGLLHTESNSALLLNVAAIAATQDPCVDT